MWKILTHLGYLHHFINIIYLFHDDLEVSVNVGGLLLEPSKIYKMVSSKVLFLLLYIFLHALKTLTSVFVCIFNILQVVNDSTSGTSLVNLALS